MLRSWRMLTKVISKLPWYITLLPRPFPLLERRNGSGEYILVTPPENRTAGEGSQEQAAVKRRNYTPLTYSSRLF